MASLEQNHVARKEKRKILTSIARIQVTKPGNRLTSKPVW